MTDHLIENETVSEYAPFERATFDGVVLIVEPTDCMLDLETLGTAPFSPILSIGACAFKPDQVAPINDAFYQAITLESCLDVGLRPSADTILWWMDQAAEARGVFSDPLAVKLPLALDAFTDWLNSRPLKMWGNSARFDLGLLEAAYKACGKVAPWEFYNERDYRTLKKLTGADGIPLHRVGTHHNAVDDAISQAYHLMAIYKGLGLQ
jgi:hypothetical protein